MSTRANIIIRDAGIGQDGKSWEKLLIFYRHSDGYPEGVKDSLDTFIRWLRTGRIRDNLPQAAGWLVIIGAEEYKRNHIEELHDRRYDRSPLEILYEWEGKIASEPLPRGSSMSWKVGAYEPTTCIHGDIKHLYIIDLHSKEWWEADIDDWKWKINGEKPPERESESDGTRRIVSK